MDSTHEESAKCSLESIRVQDHFHGEIFYLADNNLVIESNFFLSEYLATFERYAGQMATKGREAEGSYLSRELGAEVERFRLHLET